MTSETLYLQKSLRFKILEGAADMEQKWRYSVLQHLKASSCISHQGRSTKGTVDSAVKSWFNGINLLDSAELSAELFFRGLWVTVDWLTDVRSGFKQALKVQKIWVNNTKPQNNPLAEVKT